MSEWISVKDRLPSDDSVVLAFHEPYIDLCSYEDGRWRDQEWMEWEVTHWMPLPEPPK